MVSANRLITGANVTWQEICQKQTANETQNKRQKAAQADQFVQKKHQHEAAYGRDNPTHRFTFRAFLRLCHRRLHPHW
jgi:hypothetical protein